MKWLVAALAVAKAVPPKLLLESWHDDIAKDHASRIKRDVAHLQHGSFLEMKQEPIQIFVPKVSIANVTKPTALPPPPPTLDAYKDYQPFDTAIGNLVMNQFVAPVTATPPPSQSALNLAYGCPALLEFPTTITVHAPSGCKTERDGVWTDTAEANLMQWTELCTPDLAISAAPVVKYSLANGDVFGYSRESPWQGGKVIELLDCGVRVLFTVGEKVALDKMKTNGPACKKYGSCDGTVYVQYSIHQNGKLLASTPYLTLFEDTFKWSSPDGIEVATVSRIGGWSPRDECPKWSKTWLVKINSGAAAPFNEVTTRWPIVEAVTMMALRDELRRNDGVVSYAFCDYANKGTYIAIMLGVGATAALLSLVFYVFLLEKMTAICFQLEYRLLPRNKMYRQSKFDP